MSKIHILKLSLRATVSTVGALLLLLVPLQAGAVHLTPFEVDGNSVVDATGTDWDAVIGPACNTSETGGGVDRATCVTDPTSGDTGFVSSTDTEDISGWAYETVTNEETPPKDNIKHAFGALYHDGTGDQILYFGLDRDTNNGTAQVGFWFLKSKVTLGASGTFVDGVGAAAHHTNGDILVQANFEKGGNVTRLSVYDWQSGVLHLLSQTDPGDNAGCNDPDDTVCVGVNAAATDLSWRSGIDTGIFFEGGINLTELGLNIDSCISQFIAETRSSAEFTSQLKDFAFGDLNTCEPLEVTKTANTSLTRTQNWSIDKSVTPSSWDLFKGDSGTSEYTVTVTKGGTTDSNWAVSGNITIHNPNSASATVTGVSDSMTGSLNATVNCPVTFPYVLAGNGNLVCTYTRSLPDGTARTNTATVTTNGNVPGGDGTASVDFATATVTPVNTTVSVDDSFAAGDKANITDTTSYTYSRTFSCDADEGTINNTATIVETSQSDSASVTVNCHDLTVTKDATTSFNRSWDWTIDKSADQIALTLAPGELFGVNYTVTVDADSTDSAWAVSGNITVHNPAPIAATINSVADVLATDGSVTVTCTGIVFPYTLASGGDLICTYTKNLSAANNQLNTATAALQNHSFDKTGTPTNAGTTNFTGTANVTFSSTPTNEYEECVDVTDNNVVGNLGTVCASQAPHTYTYKLYFGTDGSNTPSDGTFVQVSCGHNDHDNTATCTTNDNAVIDTDTWMLDIDVECASGCTLTQGYWKTHNDSFHGGAPTDDNWANLSPSKEGTSFFLSGQTWFQVFWTAPKGNVYYNLAHQYMAAKLNILNGAQAPASVTAAITAAAALFNQYTPADIAVLKGKNGNAIRSEFLTLAGTLGSFNEGLIGPGHCSEQNPPVQ